MGNKIYIIYYAWLNTKNNHAGMAYYVKRLKKEHPKKIRLIKVPNNFNKWNRKKQKAFRLLLTYFLKISLTPSDTLLLMEYLGNRSGNQTGLALRLRNWKVKFNIAGVVHLSGKNLMELYNSEEYISKAIGALDKVIVFGSSLKEFFETLGVGENVVQTYHYVDTQYYKPAEEKQPKKRLQVISMGSIKRNHHELKSIVTRCPDIDFHICMGLSDLREIFSDLKNATLYGYLEEQELLSLMQQCDVSLSVLEDTVGSNVITTSMACGLVNVVSDVGSIRDYCDEENARLCKSSEEFIDALKILHDNKQYLEVMSKNAIERAMGMSIDKSIKIFPGLLQ